MYPAGVLVYPAKSSGSKKIHTSSRLELQSRRAILHLLQGITMQLLDLRKNYHFSIANLRSHIHENLIRNRPYRRDRYGLTDTLEQRLERKKRYRQFGKALHKAITSQDCDNALELVNLASRKLSFNTNWRDFFENVFSVYVEQCHDCDCWHYQDDSHNVEDNYDVCDSCVNNYYWNDRQDYYQEDDPRYDDDEEDNGFDNIGSRHSSKHNLGHIPSSFDNRKPRVLLGLELEVECVSDDRKDIDELAGNLMSDIGYHAGSRYALCEEDSSLDDGFEIVTGYTGLDVHAKALERFKTRIAGLRSHDTHTCGLHVHICKSDMSTLHASKLVLFINDDSNQKLIRAIARRSNNSYAQVKNKKEDKSWLKDALQNKTKASQLRCLNTSRYEALNFQNDKTVEFRLFKGSLKYLTIMACLEFTYASWFFSRDTSVTELTTENFLAFICKDQNKQDTSHLREYLDQRGFSTLFGITLTKEKNLSHNQLLKA